MSLKLQNKTGLTQDTRLMVNGRNVMPGLHVRRMHVVIEADDLVRLTLECDVSELDIDLDMAGITVVQSSNQEDRVTRKTIAQRCGDLKNELQERWRRTWSWMELF